MQRVHTCVHKHSHDSLINGCFERKYRWKRKRKKDEDFGLDRLMEEAERHLVER